MGLGENSTVSPLAAICDDVENIPWATPDGQKDAERYAEAGYWTAVWEVLAREGAIHEACSNFGKAETMRDLSDKAFERGESSE